jgi:hypothetical protein
VYDAFGTAMPVSKTRHVAWLVTELWRLDYAIAQHGRSSDKCKELVKFVRTRTETQVRNRVCGVVYREQQKSKARSGAEGPEKKRKPRVPWTPEENAAFAVALRDHGKASVEQLAAAAGKSSEQIKQKLVSLARPRKMRSGEDDDEDSDVDSEEE